MGNFSPTLVCLVTIKEKKDKPSQSFQPPEVSFITVENCMGHKIYGGMKRTLDKTQKEATHRKQYISTDILDKKAQKLWANSCINMMNDQTCRTIGDT